MRIKDNQLDTKDSYDGTYVGGQGGSEGAVGGDGNVIVGLHGKVSDQGKIEALSAISTSSEVKPAEREMRK